MDQKHNYLSYGFRQLPEVIAVSKRFTSTEKLIISKVFDMMWMNKENRKYAGCAWPSNEYLKKWCNVGEKSISRCKSKVKALGLFSIVKRWNASDLWILKSIPDVFVEEFEAFIDDLAEIKEKREMSNNDLAEIMIDMDENEQIKFLIDNPDIGKIS